MTSPMFFVHIVGSKSATSVVKSESASAAPSPRSPLPSTPTSSTPAAVPSATSNNVTRTTKTDGVTIPTRNNKVRDKCCEMIYDALAGDSNARKQIILTCKPEIVTRRLSSASV